jgi:hypothetical protein
VEEWYLLDRLSGPRGASTLTQKSVHLDPALFSRHGCAAETLDTFSAGGPVERMV